MHIEHHAWFSPALGHEMEFKVYGHAGQPILAFPAQNGRFYDFEHFGMVGACANLIQSGRVRIYAVDSIDWQSWTNTGVPPSERAKRHGDYARYIALEMAPFIREHSHALAWTTGCSMGAFHAAGNFFRHPELFDGVIALSGLYQPSMFVGDFMNDDVYFASPLHFLPNLQGEPLERLRHKKIVVCVGQGNWEAEMIEDTRTLAFTLAQKGIPAWIDFWGGDVDHDWPWWRQQLPYFLERML